MPTPTSGSFFGPWGWGDPPEGSLLLDSQQVSSYCFLSRGPPQGHTGTPPGGEMTKADLVENVTASIARTAGPMISKKDCARVVDAFLDAVKEALKQQHNIEVRGFGTFKIRRRKT